MSEYITTARAAEVNAARRMRELGFADAQPTPVGADGGVDVTSSLAIAQVKWRGGQTGRPDLQRLFGARGDSSHLQLFFFAASGYSRGAVSYADSVGMKLFTYDPLGVVEAANAASRELMAQCRAGSGSLTANVDPDAAARGKRGRTSPQPASAKRRIGLILVWAGLAMAGWATYLFIASSSGGGAFVAFGVITVFIGCGIIGMDLDDQKRASRKSTPRRFT